MSLNSNTQVIEITENLISQFEEEEDTVTSEFIDVADFKIAYSHLLEENFTLKMALHNLLRQFKLILNSNDHEKQAYNILLENQTEIGKLNYKIKQLQKDVQQQTNSHISFSSTHSPSFSRTKQPLNPVSRIDFKKESEDAPIVDKDSLKLQRIEYDRNLLIIQDKDIAAFQKYLHAEITENDRLRRLIRNQKNYIKNLEDELQQAKNAKSEEKHIFNDDLSESQISLNDSIFSSPLKFKVNPQTENINKKKYVNTETSFNSTARSLPSLDHIKDVEGRISERERCLALGKALNDVADAIAKNAGQKWRGSFIDVTIPVSKVRSQTEQIIKLLQIGNSYKDDQKAMKEIINSRESYNEAATDKTKELSDLIFNTIRNYSQQMATEYIKIKEHLCDN